MTPVAKAVDTAFIIIACGAGVWLLAACALHRRARIRIARMKERAESNKGGGYGATQREPKGG